MNYFNIIPLTAIEQQQVKRFLKCLTAKKIPVSRLKIAHAAKYRNDLHKFYVWQQDNSECIAIHKTLEVALAIAEGRLLTKYAHEKA